MSNLPESIELTYIDRDLILRYGYVEPRLERALKRWPDQQSVRKMRLSRYELEMLIGQLSRSFNHDETGDDGQAVLDLCDRLEYAEKTGDGTHPRIIR